MKTFFKNWKARIEERKKRKAEMREAIMNLFQAANPKSNSPIMKVTYKKK